MNQPPLPPKEEDGYELWLRYRQVQSKTRLEQYRQAIPRVGVLGEGPTPGIIRQELGRALPALLGHRVPIVNHLPDNDALIVGSVTACKQMGIHVPEAIAAKLGRQGFWLHAEQGDPSTRIVLTGSSDVAALSAVFHFLRLLQTEQEITSLDVISCPRIDLRILGHWDNLDGSIERGYAGKSLWNWDELPQKIDPRYHDYARACASIGINGSNLNNVNANSKSLTGAYLQKAAALADLFRPYGIRIYLSPVFSAPIQLGELETADPRQAAVARWWQKKVDEIYRLIPDFGGFQVKANSEGQPGPQDYAANHHDGANMLARALQPYGGTLLWRAFVYDTRVDYDRTKCAYKEFVPLDGKFEKNVMVLAKNGPVDYQPREPFHPLFGAMQHTPLALELQITQEYFGQSIHLVYLGEMWKEVLEADTYSQGPGSTVARLVDGSLDGHTPSCVVAVANSGSDRNWCGHHFSQANWYAYGRLAWDHQLSAAEIAEEWIRMTWSNENELVEALKACMLASWPACIGYMTPLGLHHLMQEGHHYGPDPGFHTAPRQDWNNVYYHRADAQGIGFNRSHSGSNATGQYHSPLREQFDHLHTCPEKYLLWFHHVAWDHRLQSGKTLWQELQDRYRHGVEVVEQIQRTWETLAGRVDPQRHTHVSQRLAQQLENARQWRDRCLEYFGGFI